MKTATPTATPFTVAIIALVWKKKISVNRSELLAIDVTTAFTILESLEYKLLKRFLVQGREQYYENSPSFQISWTWSAVFRINENFIQQLSAMANNQALAGWITNQNFQFLYSPLEIILTWFTNLINKYMRDVICPQSKGIQLTSCTACADYDAITRRHVQLICVRAVWSNGFWDTLRSLNSI